MGNFLKVLAMKEVPEIQQMKENKNVKFLSFQQFLNENPAFSQKMKNQNFGFWEGPPWVPYAQKCHKDARWEKTPLKQSCSAPSLSEQKRCLFSKRWTP
jgi:hypothetical protein